jgi:hypothetical protein
VMEGEAYLNAIEIIHKSAPPRALRALARDAASCENVD